MGDVPRAMFVVTMIGVTTFDGLSGTDFWEKRDTAAVQNPGTLGVQSYPAQIISGTIGLLPTIGLLMAVYRWACRARDRLGEHDLGGPSGRDRARARRRPAAGA